MKISEVVSLLKAGYTKKEIDELRAAENVVTPAIEDASVPEPAAPAVPDGAPAAAAPAAPGPDNSEVLQAIKDLTKTLQMQNIRNDVLTPSRPETAVDILGSIINKYEKEST